MAAGAPFDAARFAWGQLVVTATQLMTHYANDYFDLEADRANRTPTRWSGGSRVLPDGVLPPGGRAAARAAAAGASPRSAAALALALRAADRPLLLPIAAAMIGARLGVQRAAAAARARAGWAS